MQRNEFLTTRIIYLSFVFEGKVTNLLFIFLILSFCLAVISCDTKSSSSGRISIDNTSTTFSVWISEDGGGFRLFPAKMVDALCLSTLLFCFMISWGLIPRPLGRKYLIPITIPSCLLRGSIFWFLAVRCRQPILYANKAKEFSIETGFFR